MRPLFRQCLLSLGGCENVKKDHCCLFAMAADLRRFKMGEVTNMFSCKGCKKRVYGCHDTCKKYLAEKAAHEARKKKENIEKGLYYYVYDQVERNRDSRGKKWGMKDKKD